MEDVGSILYVYIAYFCKLIYKDLNRYNLYLDIPISTFKKLNVFNKKKVGYHLK